MRTDNTVAATEVAEEFWCQVDVFGYVRPTARFFTIYHAQISSYDRICRGFRAIILQHGV